MSGVSLEVKRETVWYEMLVGHGSVERPFHQVLHLPGGLPRVSRVVGAYASARVLGREVKPGAVDLEGILRVRTFYVAHDDDSRPVWAVDHVVPFDASVPIEGAAPGDTAWVRACVVKATCQPHDDTALACELLVSIHVRVYRRVEVKVVSGVQEDGGRAVHATSEKLRLHRVVARDYANLTASQTLVLPTGAPEVLEVVACDVRAQALESQCADGQVTVEGLLKVRTLYTCRTRQGEEEMEAEDQAEARSRRGVYCCEHDLPFEQTLRIHEARAGMKVIPSVTVDSVDSTCTDRRTLRIEVALQVDVEVYCEVPCDVVTQVTCEPYDVDTCVQSVRLCCLTGDAVSECAVREDVHLPQNMPDVDRVVAFFEAVRPVQATVAPGKCLVEGVLSVLVMYVAADHGCDVEATECTLRLQAACDVEGVQEGAHVEVELLTDQCSVESIDCRTIRIRALVSARCRVVQCVELPVVTDVVVVEPCEDYAEAPLRFVVVQKGDTLWNLARKYNTTVAAIVAANNIVNPDLIYPGQVLCIPVCEPKG